MRRDCQKDIMDQAEIRPRQFKKWHFIFEGLRGMMGGKRVPNAIIMNGYYRNDVDFMKAFCKKF